MDTSQSRSRQRSSRQPLMPLLVSRRSYLSTVLNLLIFGLVGVAGMWIVHQTEYAIEYGSRFGVIMASTPHRFYMVPLGVVLGLLAVTLAILTSTSLLRTHRARCRLLPGIPIRSRHHAAAPVFALPIGPLLRTAAVLATLQMILYTVQENLESLAAGWGLPALDVLFAPQHATVVPLHLLLALCGAFLLWTVSLLLHRIRHTLCVTRALAGIGASRKGIPARANCYRRYSAKARLLASRRSLRSPPLAA
jgi:hypothetical protein